MKSASPATTTTPAPAAGDQPAEPNPSGFYLGRFDQEPARPSRPGVARPRKANRSHRRTGLLVAMLVVSAAAWGIQALNTTRHEPPPLLGADRFSHVEAVQAVTPKPPSLYVRLDTGAWVRMSPQQRHETLEEIGRIAGEAGYLGVHARTGDGTAVGQWLEIRGVQVFPEPGGAS